MSVPCSSDQSPTAKVSSVRVENRERQRRAELERAMIFHAAAWRILWVHALRRCRRVSGPKVRPSGV
jgi:hypothetical protein